VTFLLYYFAIAQHVLHEPGVAGTTLFGDALGFMNWVILWLLWYALFLGSYGVPGLRAEPVETSR